MIARWLCYSAYGQPSEVICRPGAYPPGPRSRYPGALLLAFRRDSLGLLTSVAQEHGDITHSTLGRKHLYLLNHPDYIRDVLVTYHRRFTGLAFEAAKSLTGEGLLSAQGEAHRRQRRLVQPAFHRDRLPAYAATMVEHAQRWRDRQHDGAVMAIRSEMRRLTLGVVGETMFGATDGDAADDVRGFTRRPCRPSRHASTSSGMTLAVQATIGMRMRPDASLPRPARRGRSRSRPCRASDSRPGSARSRGRASVCSASSPSPACSAAYPRAATCLTSTERLNSLSSTTRIGRASPRGAAERPRGRQRPDRPVEHRRASRRRAGPAHAHGGARGRARSERRWCRSSARRAAGRWPGRGRCRRDVADAGSSACTNG